ncbi:hypothetical protein X777_00458, partial [Ooceraea biroi]
NLTNIYYGRILLTYLRHHHLGNVWQEFINRPLKHQLLEEVITFIIQWFYPEKNVSCSHINMDLDNIAQQVIKRLKKLREKYSQSMEVVYLQRIQHLLSADMPRRKHLPLGY